MPSRKVSVFTHSVSVSSFETAHASRSPVSAQSHTLHAHTRVFGFKLGFGVGAGVSVFFFLLFLLLHKLKQKWKQNRAWAACPRNSIKLRKFAYGELKMATQGFGDAHKLGQGGFGAVYKGILKGGQEVAVKKLDVVSFQGEREFQNELSVIGHVCVSPHIVSLVGFCASGKKRLLVYEYMHNRSLQEALFDEGYHAQLGWARRFDIIVETAKALAFLHACEPPIVHGDIKPSNVLLDVNFCAKIADFGLARFKTGSEAEYDEGAENSAYVERCKHRRQRRYANEARKQTKDVPVVCVVDVKTQQQLEPSSVECNARKSVSSVFTTSPDSDASSITGKPPCKFSQNSKDTIVGQRDSLPSDRSRATSATPLHEVGSELLHSSTENCADMHMQSVACKPVQESAKPNIGMDAKAAQFEGEKLSGNNGEDGELTGGPWKEKQRGTFGQDWWWRQELSGELSVKDYVMDWMGYDSRKDALGVASEACLDGESRPWKGDVWRRAHSQSSDLWGGSSQEEGAGQPSSENSSSCRTKRRSEKERPRSREWWKDEEIVSSKDWKTSKKKREHSQSREWSGEICSRGVSSTPSMRGTICYVAPENGSIEGVSEKCDVYSFGVLLLVMISGRRPLQVTASPIIEFERANLISWARHLACSGGILELVDPSLHGEFCRKQATLAITVALLCLQRLPSKRPSMNEVLKMLLGEIQAPLLPSHFSPSPPCRVPYRSRRCSLSSEGATVDSSMSS